jgi:HD-GYP domain-containing protein (c-di-GMP phosphodiesterase class II)
MTVRLAREMGVRREKISDIYRGALLHDIGKMGIPDRILHKEGPLDDEEWDLMKTHPLLAHELLSDIPYLENAVEIPYSHHERWDGSGYPQGLEGEQIPLAARIFAVVDVWDALKSERPYREAWPEEKVLDYLRDQAGQEFDPAVVEAFLKLQDQPGLESGAQ